MTEAAMVPERPRRQRGGLVGPLALIGAGVVLLLNNLGVLDWGVWVVLLQLWPVLLIAVGLDLIVGRGSRLASLLIGLVALGALAAGAWYLGAAPATAAAVEAVSYDVGGATRADVDLALGAGELRLAAMAEPDGLIAGTVPLASGERLERVYAVRGGAATVGLRSVGPANVAWGAGDARAPWDLRLSGDLPLQLRVSTGAGRAQIDLSRLQVSGLELSAGVGQVDVTLPERGRLTASISAGVGETVVRVPAGVAARIHVSGGLGGTHVDPRFARSGDTYTSADYATAADRVDLEISSGVGDVRVETAPEE